MISTRLALLILAGATFAACSNSGDDGGNAGTGAQSGGGTLGSGQTGGSGGTSAGSGGGDSSAGSAGTNGRGGEPADGSAGTGGSGGEGDAATEAGAGCNARTGGALIRFQIGSEMLTTWITNDSFIQEAQRLREAGQQRVPSFSLLDGTDCDPQWTWHVDPASAAFADVTIEVCDGLPSHIENDKPYWLQTLGSYCPWSARVVSVDDRP